MIKNVNVSAKSVNEIFQFPHDLTIVLVRGQQNLFGSSPILAVDRETFGRKNYVQWIYLFISRQNHICPGNFTSASNCVRL